MSTTALVLIDRPAAGQTGTGPAFRVVDPGAPALRVSNLAAVRGDGIFETAAIRDGVVQAAAAHRERFARSAQICDLPRPDDEVYAQAVAAGLDQLDDASDAFVKYVLVRGDEQDDPQRPLGWAYLAPSADYTTVRRDGLAAVTLSRGFALAEARHSPWLLLGAKTLSYAVNQAVVREAVRRGAQEVVLVSTDGFVLEGPTSTLVARLGDELVTPRPDSGILAGTTQRSIFDLAGGLGLRTAVRDVRVQELAGADGLWLVSSVRLAVPLHTLDGQGVRVDAVLTEAFNAGLIARTS